MEEPDFYRVESVTFCLTNKQICVTIEQLVAILATVK